MRIRDHKPIPATRNRLTVAREQRVWTAIALRGKTIRIIATEIAVPEARVRYALSVLHRAGQVHVSAWNLIVCPDGKSRHIPEFIAGKGWDAHPPDGVQCRGMGLRYEPANSAIESIFFLWRHDDDEIK